MSAQLFHRGRTAVISLREYRLGSGIVDGGEKEFLIGIEVKSFSEHSELHRLQVFRTFGDDDHVSPVLSREWFAKPACRKQCVVDDEPVIVYK